MTRSYADFGPGLLCNFKESPWKDNYKADYIEQSPMTYAEKIVTPSLILADTGDQRVPTAQAIMLYRILDERGVESKMVLYKADSHFPEDHIQGEDVLRRAIGWIKQHLK